MKLERPEHLPWMQITLLDMLIGSALWALVGIFFLMDLRPRRRGSDRDLNNRRR